MNSSEPVARRAVSGRGPLAPVPSRHGAPQLRRAADLDGARANELSPLDHAEVPLGKTERILDHHNDVVAEPGVGFAEFALPPLDEQPRPNALAFPVVVAVLEPDDHALLREPVVAQEHVAPRPDGRSRIGVLHADVRPLLRPVTKCAQHRATGRGPTAWAHTANPGRPA